MKVYKHTLHVDFGKFEGLKEKLYWISNDIEAHIEEGGDMEGNLYGEGYVLEVNE